MGNNLYHSWCFAVTAQRLRTIFGPGLTIFGSPLVGNVALASGCQQCVAVLRARKLTVSVHLGEVEVGHSHCWGEVVVVAHYHCWGEVVVVAHYHYWGAVVVVAHGRCWGEVVVGHDHCWVVEGDCYGYQAVGAGCYDHWDVDRYFDLVVASSLLPLPYACVPTSTASVFACIRDVWEKTDLTFSCFCRFSRSCLSLASFSLRAFSSLSFSSRSRRSRSSSRPFCGGELPVGAPHSLGRFLSFRSKRSPGSCQWFFPFSNTCLSPRTVRRL
ncbi:hypothetical protein EJ08DRAFT_520937 [Tothia fuscella]|uniref:Uncharacterized protein n=1 Tax=Tothia fuscella TaxID=1048955 RepID=A0A9P4NGV4_9PEZI|nr:hypothetical protein EJ08DRAFT_520937 [Tothia fuscella]